MNLMFRSTLLAFTAVFAVVLFRAPIAALEKPETELTEVGLDTKLGTKIDLSLSFTAEDGTPIVLSQLMKPGRPMILVPAYYHCPRLCGLLLQGVTELLNKMTALRMGEDFQVITVSFDTTDTPALAREQAQNFSKQLINSEAAPSWRFLVGNEQNVGPLMRQIGFNYLPDRGEFAHTAAIMLLTPSGEISQYFTGIQFSQLDVRLALVEASRGTIGSALDHILLFCFRFDPTKGKYTWAAFNIMRAGGALTLLFLAGLVYRLWRLERRKARAAAGL